MSLDKKHYVTPIGFKQLEEELQYLLKKERPKIVETVRWAAGNGDRSENGDYIYGKKRLREIDRRLRYLTKRIDNAVVVDPKLQKNLDKVFFGAKVQYIDENDNHNSIQIVGIDEADMSLRKISYTSPVAKALIKSQVNDVVYVNTPNGKLELEVLAISYDT